MLRDTAAQLKTVLWKTGQREKPVRAHARASRGQGSESARASVARAINRREVLRADSGCKNCSMHRHSRPFFQFINPPAM
jgi:hypothetical protein